MVYVITVHLHANDHPDSVDKIKAKLIEASRVYSKDKETLSWFVMQSTSDPRDFTIVERYEKESVSQETPSPSPQLPQRGGCHVRQRKSRRGSHQKKPQTSRDEPSKTKQVIDKHTFFQPPYRARSITSRTHTGRLLTLTSSPSSTGPWTCGAPRSSTPARTSSCRLRCHAYKHTYKHISNICMTNDTIEYHEYQ